MADISMSTTPRAAMSGAQLKTWIAAFFAAGAAAFLAFDFFGQVLSPAAGYARLSPVGLANSTIQALFGSGYRPGAYALHFLAGLIAYPLGWIMIAEPLRKRVAPFVPWGVSSVIYGVVLWVFALFVMAHLVAGMPAFLGWTGITWVALWGHIIYAVVLAVVWKAWQRDA